MIRNQIFEKRLRSEHPSSRLVIAFAALFVTASLHPSVAWAAPDAQPIAGSPSLASPAGRQGPQTIPNPGSNAPPQPVARAEATPTPRPVAAHPQTQDSGSSGPGVLFLATAATAAHRLLERNFLTQLRLTLDEFKVQTAGQPGTGFAAMSLAHQVPMIRSLLRRSRAVACVWLSFGPSNLVLLNLVSVSTGRALVRIVESRAKSGAPANLALATRELLGTAYLFSPHKAQVTRALTKVVRSVRKRVSLPRKPSGPVYSVGLIGLFASGVYGHTGTWIESGGGLRLGLHLVAGLWGRVAFQALVTNLGQPDQGSVTGWRASVEASLFYAWHVGPILLGPTAGVDLGAAFTKITLSPTIKASTLSPLVRLPVGFELRWIVGHHLSIMLAAEAAARPRQDRFVRTSNHQVVLASPWLDAGATLGIVYSPGW